MRFNNTDTYGFQHALRGMRNPKNSWDKGDTHVTFGYNADGQRLGIWNETFVHIGPNDLKLAQTLIRAGSEHRKFLRQITVWVDITAPLYWWKEFDTYKIGTTANSTSTMHKITSKEITLSDFSVDETQDKEIESYFSEVVANCEKLREKYLETKDYKYWKALIQLLPESYNQTRTVSMNYENLYTMVRQRKNHKLMEWSVDFISWVKTLPYAKELIFIDLD